MNEEIPAATPEMFNSVLAQMIPRAASMGIEVVELRPGYVKSRTPIEGNGNHIGTMYAGVLFTAAELLGGAIALSTFDVTKYYPVIKAMTINYRRPAKGAVFAEASISDDLVAELPGRRVPQGRRSSCSRRRLPTSKARRAATTEGAYQLRTHGS